ncbi:hypothetical protein [Microbacterium sp. USHLN186]|uniref:hypothetical protein n=1 Tax=Microbacterium sp. USHLN186 TaxID=3081286 RepID=UPI0030160879
MTTTFARATSGVAAVCVLIGMLSACTPEPEPKPTKTALFASDEEAFAAAEETYRAYVAGLNETDLRNDETFEPVYNWLTASALSSERENLSYYHAEHLTRVGETTFDSYTPVSRSAKKIVANLCLDVSGVDLLNVDSQSVLPEDRVSRRALKVTFVPGDTPTQLKIASNHQPESFKC